MSDRLTQVFADVLELPLDRLTDDSSPANTPEWDSLATVNLAMAIEFEFGVKLNTRDSMSMTTIGLARSVLTAKGVSVA